MKTLIKLLQQACFLRSPSVTSSIIFAPIFSQCQVTRKGATAETEAVALGGGITLIPFGILCFLHLLTETPHALLSSFAFECLLLFPIILYACIYIYLNTYINIYIWLYRLLCQLLCKRVRFSRLLGNFVNYKSFAFHSLPSNHFCVCSIWKNYYPKSEGVTTHLCVCPSLLSGFGPGKM